MSRVIILRGVPGSGKSTWVNQYLDNASNQEVCLVISRDTIRKSLFGSEAAHGVDEDEVTRVFNTFYVEYMKIFEYAHGSNTLIIDNTNCDWKRVEELASVANRLDIPVEIVVIDTDLDEALRRNANRDRVVPEHVIRRMYDQLQETKDYTL